MKSLILEYIKNNENWLEDIQKMNIEVKMSNNLALFKYNMAADFNNPIVQEARGIIIDVAAGAVVCWPFRKFGNYGESYADPIDWTSARVQEKLDGSIIKLWYYNGAWEISTNGSICAFDVKNAQGYNFGKLVFAAFMNQDIKYFDLDKDYTYIFELTSPNNQIIVPYKETILWHIGTRNNKTGEEVNMNIGCIKPKEYPLTSLEDCIAFAKEFSAQEHEGFVVVDKNWNRVKVKSPDYVAAHHMANNSILTKKRVIELICDNEVEEYLTYFPDKENEFNKVKQEIEYLKKAIEKYCEKVAGAALERREYAIHNSTDEYFSFAINKVYNHKEIELPKKFLVNKLVKEEENGN